MHVRLAALLIVAATLLLSFNAPSRSALGPSDLASICQSDKAKLSNVITACTALIESEAIPNEHLVTYLRERGWAYYCSGQYEQAIADETHVLALQPGDAESMLARAKNYEALDDLDAAAAEYRKALLTSPEDPQILFKQARLFSKQGEELAASNGYRRALELDPGFAKAAWRYTNSLFELDGPSATGAFLSEARQKWPDQPWVYNAYMSFELGYGGDLQNALQAAEIYAGMRPEPYTEFFLPALIHLRMGSDDRGIEFMEAYAANSVEQDYAEKNAVLGFIERAFHLAVYRQDQSWIYRSIGYAAAGRAELATKEINQYRERAWINGDSVLLDIIEGKGVSVPREARQGSKAHIDQAIAAYIEKLRVDIDLVY